MTRLLTTAQIDPLAGARQSRADMGSGCVQQPRRTRPTPYAPAPAAGGPR